MLSAALRRTDTVQRLFPLSQIIHLLVLIQVYDIAATSLAFKTVLEQLMYFIDGQFFLFLLLVNFQNIFRHPKPNSFILCPCLLYVDIVNHTSKMNDLCSSLNSEEMLQNFLYLYKKKTQVVFFIFHFEQLSFFPL